MGRYLLVVLLLFSKLLFSQERFSEGEDNVITNFSGVPSSTIAGCVNAITGDYFEQQIDIAVPGLEPLLLERTYCSSSNKKQGFGCCWSHNHDNKIFFSESPDEDDWSASTGSHSAIFYRFGAQVLFEGRYRGSKKDPLVVKKKILKQGITNTSKGVISGQTNIKNEQLTFKESKGVICHTDGTGTSTFYHKRHGSFYHHLSLVKMANKQNYQYDYNDQHKLTTLALKNGSGMTSAVLDFLRIPKEDFRRNPVFKVVASNGLEARYHYQKHYINGRKERLLSSVELPWSPREDYYYEKYEHLGRGNHSRVVEKRLPLGRYRQIQYYKYQSNVVENQVINLEEIGDPRINRVAAVKAPVGIDETPVITHRFFYKVNHNGEKGRTDVIDAGGCQTSYHFRGRSLSHIERRNQDKQVYSIERFHWGGYHSNNYTNLIARTYEDKKGIPQICHHYRYDRFGNVTTETLSGNLTGENKAPVLLESDATPKENGCEHFRKSYQYTQDGYNLKIKESDGSKTITYRYLPNSNLLQEELTWVEGIICQRIFYEYDSSGFLIRKTIDDGKVEDRLNFAGVTERRVTVQFPTTAAPLGLVGEEQERFWDPESGEELLLKRVVNHYSLTGDLTCQEHYDSNNERLFTLYWEYDSHGNVIREVNPLGEVVTREYDANDNLLVESGPHRGFNKHFCYDYSNRLVSKTLCLPDGETLTNHYSYNHLSEFVEEKDWNGNATKYRYDCQGHRVEIRYPSVEGVVESCKYDILGHLSESSDANGNITRFSCTARGEPYHITFPSGAEIKKVYSLDGLLKREVAPDGTVTSYEYDYQKRLTALKVHAFDGTQLSEVRREYNAFHQIREVDSAGVVTSFQYDTAGRLVCLKRAEMEICYSYDSSGNQESVTQKFRGEVITVTRKKYDLLSRVISESIEDGEGHLQSHVEYRYDCGGHRTHLITYKDEGPAVSKTEYDPLGRVVKETDPEGNVTHMRYLEGQMNASGQFVSQKEVTDPRGITTRTTADLRGRDAQVQRFDPFGKLLQETLLEYDNNNNLVKRLDHLIYEGEFVQVQERRYVCDSSNRLTSVIQAFGSPEERKWCYRYDLMGRKVETVKPDGIKLFSSYDGLGRVVSVRSSDGSVDYRYSYDLLNNPIAVYDAVNQLTTLRAYDIYSHLVEETLASGFVTGYDYDCFGRLQKVCFPDGSIQENSYVGQYLSSVSRRSSEGLLRYKHRYLSYDLSGNLTEEESICDRGHVQYSYDLCGRIQSIKREHWSESLDCYDTVGNLLKQTVRDPEGSRCINYSYDDLSQLKSEEGRESHHYNYDSLHNRRLKDGTVTTVNHLNQVVKASGKTYSYNLTGSLSCSESADGKVFYEYDALDRLTVVRNASRSTRYTYDPFNRRLSKSTTSESGNQTVESYLYLEQNEVAQCDSKGEVTAFRLLGSGLGAEVGAAVALEIKGALFLPIHDHIGNVRAIVSAADGECLQYLTYSAYGEEALYNSKGVSLPLEESISPWRYSSKRYDPESGWVFFGRRHYCQSLGRWTTPDPGGFIDGPNLYAFVHNNPLTHFDSYGLVDEQLVKEERDRNAGWSYIRGVGWRSQREAMNVSGYFIEKTIHHLFPDIPCSTGTLKKMIKGIARMLQDKSFYDRADQIDFYSVYIPGRETPGFEHTAGLGILSSKKAIEDFGRKYSQENLEGAAVYAYGRISKGFITDLLVDCLALRLGYIPKGVRQEAQFLSNLYNGCLKKHGTATILTISHSRGAIEMYACSKLLPAAIKQHMYVSTIGGGKMIPLGDFIGADNYINQNDIVPMTEFYAHGRADINIIVGGYKGNGSFPWIQDHLLDSYEWALKRIGEKYLGIERGEL